MDDVYRRTLWQLAQRQVADQDRTRDTHPDDPAVVALLDLLVHAWEAGAQRTLDQAKAIDDAIVRARGKEAPATVIVGHPHLTGEEALGLARAIHGSSAIKCPDPCSICLEDLALTLDET